MGLDEKTTHSGALRNDDFVIISVNPLTQIREIALITALWNAMPI